MKHKRLLLLALISSISTAETALPPAPNSDNLADYWAWFRNEPSAPPKPNNTYQLPTLHNTNQDYNARPEPLIKAPSINADALFHRVLGCYPIRSNFDLEVRFTTGIGWSPETTSTDTTLGSNYVQLVAEMPLYSSSDIERATDREYRRRDATAGVVADFVANIAKRNQAIRELALYRSLEARSRARVQAGIVDAAEQVTQLIKVANAQESLITAETRILDTRLKMSSMCKPQLAEPMTTWLKQISAVPQFDN